MPYLYIRSAKIRRSGAAHARGHSSLAMEWSACLRQIRVPGNEPSAGVPDHSVFGGPRGRRSGVDGGAACQVAVTARAFLWRRARSPGAIDTRPLTDPIAINLQTPGSQVGTGSEFRLPIPGHHLAGGHQCCRYSTRK